MPVPRGFLEIAVAAEAMGPLRDKYPQGAAQLAYPVFGRYILYWGDPNAPVPNRVLTYPMAVLYGGPGPFQWVSKDLPAMVRQWAATLTPKAGAGPGSWLVVALPVAFLVPPEALAFPWRDFRWSWFIENEPSPQYALEGVPLAVLFRNLTTKHLDLPPPLGPGPTAIAGDFLLEALGWESPWERAKRSWEGWDDAEIQRELAAARELVAGTLEDEDEIDPPVTTWLTPEEAALEAGVPELPAGTLEVPGPLPFHIEENIGAATEEILGAEPKVWAIHDVWESVESGIWRLVARSKPTYETEQQAKSWKSSWLVKNFGASGFKSPYVWVHKAGSWRLA